jgi:hypothetical protein
MSAGVAAPASSAAATASALPLAGTASENAAGCPSALVSDTAVAAIDYTLVPAQLDKRLGELEGCSVRPTIIRPEPAGWKLRFQRHMLDGYREKTLSTVDLQQERQRAFDLLDALTRSGSLPVRVHSFRLISLGKSDLLVMLIV